MRRGRVAGAAGGLVVLAVLVPACTGGGSGDPSPAAATSSPAASYREGERRPGTLKDLCRGVSPTATGKLGMKAPRIYATQGSCSWSEDESAVRVDVQRRLALNYRAYEPPETRRDYTATKEAEFRFRRLEGWERAKTTPVRGLGDEAKLARQLNPTARYGSVWLAVRQRNVVLDVRVGAHSFGPVGNGRMPTYDAMERAATAAMRDVLGTLAGKPLPQPTSSPRAAESDVTEVGNVCRAATSAGRLVPGVRRWDTGRRDSKRSGGCAWQAGDEEPSVTVEVEAVPPSALDGASGSTVATQLVHGVSGRKRAGLGDEAKVSSTGYASGRSRTVEVVARRGNLVVAVEYQRWRHPSEKALERDAVGVAEDVLAAYR